MKNRIFLYFLFSFLIIGSCKQQDLVNEFNTSGRDLTLGEAKAFFENKVKPSKFRIEKQASTNPSTHEHDENCNHEAEREPIWDGFKYRVLSEGNQAVLVPIRKENEYIEVGDGKYVKYGFLNYAMMYKDTTGNIITEWVQLRPSLDWLNSKVSRQYDGDILVKDWNGKIKSVFRFNKGAIVPLAKKRGVEKQASIREKVASNSGPNLDYICITSKYLTYKRGTTCLCEEHTWAQRFDCTCPYTMPGVPGNYPTPSITTLHTVVDCVPLEPENPPPGGGNPPGAGGEPWIPGGGSGGAGGGDYAPGSCNPDPNYTVPTIPPPEGQDYQIPCSEMAVPVEDIPTQIAGELLLSTFSMNGHNVPSISPLSDEQNQALLDFIFQRGDNEDLVEMAYWGFNEVTSGNISWEQFENWFLGVSLVAPEYLADAKTINDVNYWMNVTFTQQNLPSFATFENNFPKRSVKTVLDLATDLGGEIGDFIKEQDSILGLQQRSFNTCALRLSIALVKSGVNIPNIDDPSGGNRKITLEDKNGNNYFIRADEMDMWMQLTFGTSDGKARFLNLTLTQVLERNTSTNANHFQYLKPVSLKDKMLPSTATLSIINNKGIYSMIVDSREFGASGHVDFLNEASVDGDFYFGIYNKMFNVWKLQ